MKPVTDPALLEQLNAGSKAVSDPALLAQLNAFGPQPSLYDRAIASPIGRGIHDAVLSPLTSLENLMGASVNTSGNGGPLLSAPQTFGGKALQQDAARAEGSYQTSLANNRNTPGYAAARTMADKIAPNTGGGFLDSVSAPYNTLAAGLSGLVTGGLDQANANADAQTQKQTTYAKEHPVLSTVGGVAGGFLASPVKQPLPAAVPQPPVPTLDALNQAKNAAYATVDSSPMKIAQPAVKSLYDDVVSKLERRGLNEKTIGNLAPKTATALDALKSAAEGDQTLQGMDIQRRIAGIAAGATDRTDRAAARLMQDHIDDFVGNLQPTQLSGPADQAAIDALPVARDLASRSFKAQQIQSIIDKAGVNGSNFSASGYENALRSGFRKLANNDRGMARFTQVEQEAIRKVATGGHSLSATNLLRQVGKLSPQGAIPMMAEMGAVATLGPHALAVPAAGLAGRMGATALTKRAAMDALDLTLLGKNLPRLPAQSALAMPQITAQSRLPIGLLGAGLLPQVTQ